MHTVVSWDISEGPQRAEIQDRLEFILQPYPFVQPLTTFYIIKTTTYEREIIYAGLAAVVKEYPDRIGYVVSPALAGSYAGSLPQPVWNQINAITS